MRRLIVRRKSFRVKGHYSHNRAGKRFWIPRHKVKASRFKIRDRGNAGRGKRIIPVLTPGSLGGHGFFGRSYRGQKRIVFKVAKIKGEKAAIGKLAALQGFFKNVKPTYSARAKMLRHMVAGSFEGRRRVIYPMGFGGRR